MNKEKIQEWFQKNTGRLCVVAVILAVLVIAFFMGEEPDSKPIIQSSGNVINIEYGSDEKTEQQPTVHGQEIYMDSSTAAVQNDITNIAQNSNGQQEQQSNAQTTVTDTQESIINQTSQITTTTENRQTVKEESTTQTTTQQETTTREEKLTCTFSISCITLLNHMDKLDKDKKDLVPADGWILKPITVEYNQGETVFDILKKVCMDRKIHMEASWTPIYNSAYVEGIHNLYQFDCGSLSGWMYCVNDVYYNYGCSQAVVHNGDTIEWVYTCDLGKDVQK